MKKVILAATVAGAFCLASCGGSSSNAIVTKGSLSEFDSLSYSVGLSFATVVNTQLADLPLDQEVLVESLIASAKGANEVSHDDAIASIQDYFMNKRNTRAAEVEATRNTADSVALANGAEAEAVAEARKNLPADAAMFADDAECDLISAALGNDLGNNIAVAKIPVQTVWLEQAFADSAAGETKMTDADANNQIRHYFEVVVPEQNKVASEEWLASIEKEKGVQKTESGILYKIEVEGDNSIMATDDRDVVKVKYTGKTRGGEVFDSSRYEDMDERRKEYLLSQSENGELPADGEIIEFPLNRVIPGWTEGMKLVGKGGRISLWIPSELAYGERGAGQNIRGNEALYFDVELVDVTPFEAPTEEAAAAEAK